MAKDEAAPAARKAVIKIADSTGETANERLVKKHLPAWVVSGGLHVVIALVALLITQVMRSVVAAPPVDTVVKMEEKTEEPDSANLLKEELGLDSNLETAVPLEREADITVEAKVTPDTAVGAPDQNSETKTDALAAAGAPSETLDVGATTEGDNPGLIQGVGGGGGVGMSPLIAGRGSGATRDKLLRAYGGNTGSELAVARGLAWLARQQRKDGYWEFDGSHKDDKLAATGLSTLPFLAAGTTHQKKKDPKENKYVNNVSLAINYLLKIQKPDGSFNQSRAGTYMYAHAIGTIALCECYGMTNDKSLLKDACQRAINYIQQAQGPNGSWGYVAKNDGDTSIVGWEIQALQSGKLCKDIVVDKNVIKKAMDFLDKVSSGSQKDKYGYTSPGASKTLTPVGLLCRYYMDGWGPQNPGFQGGVEFIMKQQMPSVEGEMNMYYYYYATQVLHFHEGDQWYKEWNPRMRDLLIKLQRPDSDPLETKGSWDQDKGISGGHWGRLGSTCMSLLTLEVYYRHTPLHRRDAGGMKELERGK